MTRLLTISTGLLLTAACLGGGGADRPEHGGVGALVSTSDASVTIGDHGEGQLVVTGEVTSLSYAAQAHGLAGYGEPTQGISITTEDGEGYALGWALMLGDNDLAAAPDVELGETVTLTLSVEMPWGTYEGVMLEDADGLVLGGVNGNMQDFGLEDYLTVTTGAALDGTFEHECGEGRRMELDAVSDTSVSVATGESAELTVDGAAATFYNLTAWEHQEVSNMQCADWVVPYSWAIVR